MDGQHGGPDHTAFRAGGTCRLAAGAVNRTLRRVGRAIAPAWARKEIRLFRAKRRVVAAYGGIRRTPRLSIRYLLFDRELDNFTYRISNTGALATFLADVLGTEPETVRGFLDELAGDRELTAELRKNLAARPDRNRAMPFGRRLGWYAIVRIRRPRLIVETGVHDGLGSTALLRALQRNEAEGYPGDLVSIDIRPSVGWLIPDDLRHRHRLVIGDALATIVAAAAERPIDMFIHDSDHRYEHETAEFETAADRISPGAVLLSDNAHASTAFADFCARHGLTYRFWREVPRHHFYSGAGIGIAIGRVPTDGDRGAANG
jgi:predicted O-methyltransferase YrrM